MRYGAERHGLFGLRKEPLALLECEFPPVVAGFGFWMVTEVFFGSVVVCAGRFVVASSYGGMKGFTAFVYVEGEAAFAAASRTCVAGCGTGVWLQFIAV